MEGFGFKDLKIWHKAIDFADMMYDFTENKIPTNNHYRLKEQIESASTAISSNIAEGKGRWSKKEFVHYLFIARGSLFESVSLLNILKRRKYISQEEYTNTEKFALELSVSLNALINSIKV